MPLSPLDIATLSSAHFIDDRAASALIFQSLAATRAFLARYRCAQFTHVMPDDSTLEDTKSPQPRDKPMRLASHPDWRCLIIPWYVERVVTEVEVTVVGAVTAAPANVELALTYTPVAPTTGTGTTVSGTETTLTLALPASQRSRMLLLYLWVRSEVDDSATVHDGKIITESNDVATWEPIWVSSNPLSSYMRTVEDTSTPGNIVYDEPSPVFADEMEAMVMQLFDADTRLDADRLTNVGYRLVYTNGGAGNGWFYFTPGIETDARGRGKTLAPDTEYWYSMFPIGVLEMESLSIRSLGDATTPTPTSFLPGDVILARGVKACARDTNVVEGENRRVHNLFPTTPGQAYQLGGVPDLWSDWGADTNDTSVALLEIEEETDVTDYGVWILLEPLTAQPEGGEPYKIRFTAWSVGTPHTTQYDQVEYTVDVAFPDKPGLSQYIAGSGTSYLEGRLTQAETSRVVVLPFAATGLDLSAATWPLHLQVEVRSVFFTTAVYVHAVLIRSEGE